MWQGIVQEKIAVQKERNDIVHDLQAKLERTELDLKAVRADLSYKTHELLELEDDVHLVRRALCGPRIFYIVFLHLSFCMSVFKL